MQPKIFSELNATLLSKIKKMFLSAYSVESMLDVLLSEESNSKLYQFYLEAVFGEKLEGSIYLSQWQKETHASRLEILQYLEAHAKKIRKWHNKMEDRIKGALVGLACGDAVGTTLEFKAKGTFEPLTDMVGGGPFNLKVGQWTDDMSMALCLAYSLVEQQEFDPVDQMDRYCRWYQDGYMSSNGDCFDIGITVSQALQDYINNGNPFSGSTDPYSSGNGSIMRLAPIPIFYHHNYDDCIKYAGESSRTTHASAECIDASKLFASLIFNAFTAETKSAIFENNQYEPHCEKIIAIKNREFITLDYDQLTGSGYVVESLISALWCFINGNSFKECILLAANIGNDADTTAAICGQIAGAYYGFTEIPKEWRNQITMAKEIEQLALSLFINEHD
ncbi:ADP-ribosylglycohydrolase family protein [Psychromonas algicola]|uniref:ADP-ribosylglycohydrolase family protein n=1 Tax=Psychromonas algicola TaxID=2555642 RepID=UPI001FBB9323|nr:ADP-ribosylglycohydrolase family protein [Psychromonas sp. RZ5]